MPRPKDCCRGEPIMGDPRGLHSLDCPVYTAWADAHIARTAEQFRQPAPARTAIDLAYAAGYRRGLREGASRG